MINPDRYLKNSGQEGNFSKGFPVKFSLFQQPGYRDMAPTENDLPDRRAQAIQGAFDALKSHGLGELSFDLVASKSGMSRQLVRHYFPDHEALMIAVCDHLARTLQRAIDSCSKCA
ncbi:TetR/AcrR family transcriptional regulator [Labrenzia sp. DG1229]|uniref:TetR/AcrR family transcriptional regulator n=1 Tax=Labrenzia sp. DG1229 TaxID=681847 RepID=UPI000AA68956|nr:TetR/AcrR family transcriptional regulator [Labrenzia sp. DG1229]